VWVRSWPRVITRRIKAGRLRIELLAQARVAETRLEDIARAARRAVSSSQRSHREYQVIQWATGGVGRAAVEASRYPESSWWVAGAGEGKWA
jgi:hypothetical protein